jgi:hypothetical protein
MDYIEKLLSKPNDERELIVKIIKTWEARGEDPATIAGHVKRWLGDDVVKNNDDGAGAEGAQPPAEQDPADELERLTDAYEVEHKVGRSQAYHAVLRANPALGAALARQRDAKLAKMARAAGDGYGTRRV